jgi:hypothetical protein
MEVETKLRSLATTGTWEGSLPHEEGMADISQMLQRRTHGYNLFQLRLVGAYLLEVHDGKIADLDGGVVQLGDHEL